MPHLWEDDEEDDPYNGRNHQGIGGESSDVHEEADVVGKFVNLSREEIAIETVRYQPETAKGEALRHIYEDAKKVKVGKWRSGLDKVARTARQRGSHETLPPS